MNLKQKKIKIKPRIKLNHNIYNLKCCYSYNPGQNNLRSFFFSRLRLLLHTTELFPNQQLCVKKTPSPPVQRCFPLTPREWGVLLDTTPLLPRGWGCCGAMFRKMFFKYARLSKIVVTLSISQFRTPHNAPYLPPKFCISIVLNFSWDDCNTQEK